MLGKSDRLRVLCQALDITEEQFVQRLAVVRNVQPQSLKEPVRDWWSHRHQPTKFPRDIKHVLQQRADELGRPLAIAQLWDGAMTPGEFAAACGTTIQGASTALSDVCRRACFESIDALPFLRLMREEHDRAGAMEALRRMSGRYFLYRMHSFERELCREAFSIEPKDYAIAASGQYIQYAEGRQQRSIELSLLVGDRWMHAIGAYRDQAAGQSQISMVHATISCTPYRQRLFAGVLHDVTDNKTAVAAQRILLYKVTDVAEMGRAARPLVLNDIRGTRLRKYRKFLRDDRDEDPFLLAIDPGRIPRIFEGPLAPDE